MNHKRFLQLLLIVAFATLTRGLPTQFLDGFSCGSDQPGVNFTDVLQTALKLIDPESVKNTVKSLVSFYAFGICGCKSCA